MSLASTGAQAQATHAALLRTGRILVIRLFGTSALGETVVSIIVTGGAGFIGSNVVHALNARSSDDLVVVDDLTDVRKIANIASASIAGFVDQRDFRDRMRQDRVDPHGVSAVIHQGAWTRTDGTDGRLILDHNYAATLEVLDWCGRHDVPIIYASSAATYGDRSANTEEPSSERALNAYAYSKLLVDQEVRRRLPTAGGQIVGLRYFNVYGPRESHKDDMASMVMQMDDAVRTDRPIGLFDASHGLPPGGHRRDFAHVDDVVNTVLWFLDHPTISGIFNCGTGTDRSFGEVAALVTAYHGRGTVEYVPMPDHFRGTYQAVTSADLRRLRATGCDVDFRPIEVGVPQYLDWRVAAGDHAI